MALFEFRAAQLFKAVQETKAILSETSRVSSGFHTIAGEMLADIANPVEGDLLVAADEDELVEMILEPGREMGLRGFNAGRLHHAHHSAVPALRSFLNRKTSSPPSAMRSRMACPGSASAQ